MNIAILSASVRVGRQTHQVAKAVAEQLMLRPNIDPTLIDLAAHEIPPLEYVLKKHPTPPADIVKIGAILDSADAMIFASPEYNGGYSSALKNTLDYFPKSTYQKKPVGVVTVSAGALGGMRAALQIQQLILALKAYPMPQMLTTGNVKQKFDDNQKLIDQSFEQKIDLFADELIWLTEALMAKKLQLTS